MAEVGDEHGDGLVSGSNERARGVHDVQAAAAQLRDPTFGSAVRGNHHRGGADVADLGARSDAARGQICQDRFVVNEVAEYGEGLTLGCRQSSNDGPLHAETHAQVARSHDSHDVISCSPHLHSAFAASFNFASQSN
jgi:hypothetical protein